MSDGTTIVDDVRAALESDPRLPHPTEVAVSEQGGTVTLRGSVGSFHQRHAAVQIAKTVRGVRRVEMSSRSTCAITGRMIRSGVPRCRR